jgi:hypothetical protein
MNNSDFIERLKNTGRNDECPCGSKKKYKKCHLAKDEAAQLEELKKQQEATKVAAKENADADKKENKTAQFNATDRPKLKDSQPAPRFNVPRRTAG